MDTQLGATSTVDPDDSPRSCSMNNLCQRNKSERKENVRQPQLCSMPRRGSGNASPCRVPGPSPADHRPGLVKHFPEGGPKLWQGLLTLPLGRPKVSNPEPGGRPTVQQTAGSGDPRRTANLKSGSNSRPVPQQRLRSLRKQLAKQAR